MTFRMFDAGAGARRPGGDTKDCQVRALVVARGLLYREAWELLYALQGELRWCSFPLIEAMGLSIERAPGSRLGVLQQFNFPAVRGRTRMTGAAFCKDFPKGRYILRLAHHVVAVKNGFLFDTWDSSGKCVYTAWQIAPKVEGE